MEPEIIRKDQVPSSREARSIIDWSPLTKLQNDQAMVLETRDPHKADVMRHTARTQGLYYGVRVSTRVIKEGDVFKVYVWKKA